VTIDWRLPEAKGKEYAICSSSLRPYSSSHLSHHTFSIPLVHFLLSDNIPSSHLLASHCISQSIIAPPILQSPRDLRIAIPVFSLVFVLSYFPSCGDLARRT
jgi:hypothetical protein